MSLDCVPNFLALPEVQRDVVEGNSTWRIVLLRLLAWKVLGACTPEERKQVVQEWLPYQHHRSSTGLTALVEAMNTTAQPSLLPPFSSGLPLCALWQATVSWNGTDVQELLQIGQAAVQESENSRCA